MAKQFKDAKKNGKAVGHAKPKITKAKKCKISKKQVASRKRAMAAQVVQEVLTRQPEFSISYLDSLMAKVRKQREERYDKVRSKMLKEIEKKKISYSFYVFDIENVHQRIDLWRQLLPRVELWFAAKALDDSKVYKACIQKGCGFDVASIHEFEKVIKLGANVDKLIFANPVKEEFTIEAAKKSRVEKMTFDSIEELQKIKKIFPEAKCVLRIAVDVTTAFYNLSEKFGASMHDVPDILKASKELGLTIIGVAFHAGSNGVTLPSYDLSIRNARRIFDMAKEMGLREMDFLDIGGGFTLIHDEDEKNFHYVGPQVGKILDEVFPSPEVQIVAEPGRYVSESVSYLLSRIIGQKTFDNGSRHYYCNNGIFQGYMNKRACGLECDQEPLNKKLEKTRKTLKTTVWGQTCDSNDWIFKDKMKPEMKTGEWLISRDHGAYHKEISCTFNGFKLPDHRYLYKL